MLPAEAYSYISSRLVKEVARLGGSIKDLVPGAVSERIRAKVAASVENNGWPEASLTA
jgi:pantetheine-phosphate adenylyltransferase